MEPDSFDKAESELDRAIGEKAKQLWWMDGKWSL